MRSFFCVLCVMALSVAELRCALQLYVLAHSLRSHNLPLHTYDEAQHTGARVKYALPPVIQECCVCCVCRLVGSRKNGSRNRRLFVVHELP